MYTTLAIVILFGMATILCIGFASGMLVSDALVFGIIFYGIATVLFAVKLYRKIKLKNQPSDSKIYPDSNSAVQEHKDEIKLLDGGEVHYYPSYYKVNNARKTNENSSALICDADQKYYHIFLNCFTKQSYKDVFDHWELVPLLAAQQKGLKICPICAYESLPDEEKLQQIIGDSNYIIARLSASTSEDRQWNLSLTHVAEYVYIEYDYDKNKYFVIDKYDNYLGVLSQATLDKLCMQRQEIINLTCCIYSIEFNNNDKYVCNIAIILGEKRQEFEEKAGREIRTKNTKKSALILDESPIETIDKCIKLDEIIRIDYKGKAIPENASIVTLKNNHKFSANDFLAIYGYQVHRTKKMQYFFFLDKSREKEDGHGNKIYPAIKITGATISHIPDLSTEEAKKYIAISYAERASQNYVVPAEEIDDLSHFRRGKYLYEKYKQINSSNYCVIDIETTGLSRECDQIIEASAVRVRDDIIVETFTQLVKPTIPIPAEATRINGITDEMTNNALTINEVIHKFMEFIGDDIVIGHNISSFDLEFIIRACHEAGIPFNNSYLDTYLLAQDTFANMPNYKLATLCCELGIAIPTHRAESDCISTKALYDKLKESNYLSKFMNVKYSF